MDYLQYYISWRNTISYIFSFKPYYKWITFNTGEKRILEASVQAVRFKPYYKWITFNTNIFEEFYGPSMEVLNLIINGLPSIHKERCLKLVNLWQEF